jgi:isopropylmalate/homocitrate/citramalate synthase
MRVTKSFSTGRASPLSPIKGAGDKSGEFQSKIQQHHDYFRIMSTSMVPQVRRQVLQMAHQLKRAIESKVQKYLLDGIISAIK